MPPALPFGRGVGGVALYRAVFPPPGAIRSVAVLSHGLAEHGGRYRELIGRLNAQGIAVYVQDHRGHGRSGGARAFIGRFEWVVDDLGAWVGEVRARHPGLALTLLGHSFGGAVALALALRRPSAAERLVLSAPVLGVDPELPRWRVWLGRTLSRLAPRAGLLKLDAVAVSRDPAVVRAYLDDPLNVTNAIPARTLVELIDAARALAARAAELAVPTLIVHGTADRLVPLRFNEPVYARLGGADLTVRTYPGLYHEVLNEPERAAVLGDLGEWLAARG